MKVLIIEDEQAAVRRLKKLLLEIDDEIIVLEDLSSIELAVNWFRSNDDPDLVLMDIHLADGSSFDIFKQVDIGAPVIFVTAYDEYALKAFKVNAIDYVLKPIKKEELSAALQKVTKPSSDGGETAGIVEKLTEAGLIKKPKRINPSPHWKPSSSLRPLESYSRS